MILSFHYPKTAGTSFRETLIQIYHGKIYLHYHKIYLDKNIERKYLYDVEIVHGHFNIKSYRDVYPDAPIITWLRDPADRVLSYYNYKKYKVKVEQRDSAKANLLHFENFLDSEQFDFFVNKFNLFFGDYIVKDFLFIGIVERYDEDMKKLSELMGWGKYQVHHLNRSLNYEKIVLTKELRERICRRMPKEYEMYMEAKG